MFNLTQFIEETLTMKETLGICKKCGVGSTTELCAGFYCAKYPDFSSSKPEGEDLDYERNYSHVHCWHQPGGPACGVPLEKHTQCCLCDVAAPRGGGWEETDRVLEMFFNDVVEATVRFIKGKSYGQNPTDYFKEQLGHWEGNLKRHYEGVLSTEREAERERIVALAEGICPKCRDLLHSSYALQRQGEKEGTMEEVGKSTPE